MTSDEGWLALPNGPLEPKLRDPDAFWAEIRRRSCGVSQATLAGRLGIEQTRVSKLERLSDLRVSALGAYVASLGGTLVLLARLPDRDVQLAAETAPQSAVHRSERPGFRANP